jgi:enamine deaminase RidA (YjgF/YER057c/UK114 family)
MPKEIILSNTPIKPGAILSPATKAGGFVYTAGLVGNLPDGSVVEGMEAQARVVLDKLKAIVTNAGGTLEDVLRSEIFLVDLSEKPLFDKVWKEYFPTNPPARMAIQITELGLGARVEVTSVAYVGE